MIYGGHLHVRLPVRHPVGLQGGKQEVEVGGIGEQVVVHPLIVRHRAVGLEPGVAQRLVHIRANGIDQGHGADLDGFLAQDLVPQGRRDHLLVGAHQLQLALELLGGRDAFGHLGLMLEAFGLYLEGGIEVEDGLAALNGLDPAGGDGLTVADVLHVVDDGLVGIPRAQEVGVTAVDLAIEGDRLLGG
ncbi:hypothetical protein D3C78_908790 [compost metagenome]